MRKFALAVVMSVGMGGAFAGHAAAAVSVGHSGWTWGNPLPQGNTLTAVEFAGGRGYAAGDFGTLLRTDDAGATWTGIPTGVTGPIARIRAVDADTVVVGSGCLLRRSDNGGQTFTRLRFTPSERECPAGVTSFFFVTKDLGYLLLDNGSVFRTDDGGQNFAAKTAVPGTRATGGFATPTDIFFTGTDTGYAVTGGSGGGVVYKTTDGGGSWVPKETAARGLNGLFFTDPTTGFAVGDGNTILKTENSGENWSPRPVPGDIPASDLSSIRCASLLVCLIATKGGERLLRTTDGGTTITAVSPSTEKIFAVAFASPTRVVGVGQVGATVVSDDAGSNFGTVGSRIGGTFNRLRATNQQLVHAPGRNGFVARTANGGQTWSTISVATSQAVADVTFPNENRGYALDVAGTALRTDNAGGTWAILDTGTSADPRAIHATDANNVLLFGPRGIRRSENMGDTFEAVGGGVRRATLFDFDVAGSALVTFGVRALYVSTNEGESWRSLRRPGGRRGRILEADFVDSRRGYVLNTDRRLWTTSNGGRKWTELPATGSSLGTDLAFGDRQNGFLSLISSSGGVGTVLRTEDGGKSWARQLITSSPLSFDGLVSPGARTAFVLSSPSRLFHTTTGGEQGRDTQLTISTSTRSFRKSSANVRIRGRLNPAVPGADVLVSARSADGTSWNTRLAPPVSTNGTFTITFKIRKTTYFVAQWAGDADNNGDGSGVLTVRKRR
jgi:photosystem II stability/assembly factor-like uncharacterized protein